MSKTPDLSKLTFGQLYKLQSAETLARVTRVYHTILKRMWNAELTPGMPYTVHAAEVMFDITARPWQRVLDFLRGPELKKSLKGAAESETPKNHYGLWTEYARVYVSESNRIRALTRAVCIRGHLREQKLLTYLTKEDATDSRGISFVVRAMTDEATCLLVRHKRGMDWTSIRELCWQQGCDPREVFWWVPFGFDGFVNPAIKPAHTPDLYEQVQEILTPNCA